MTSNGASHGVARRSRSPGTQTAALEHQRRIGDRPAVVLSTYDRRRRHTRIGEKHLVEQGVAGHFLEGTNLDSGLQHIDDEVRDALMLRCFRVGAREQHRGICQMATRRPDLLPVDDPLLAVQLGPSGEPSEIRSGTGFAEQLTPTFLAGHRRTDVLLDLLRRPVDGDRRRRQQHAQTTGCRQRAKVRNRCADSHGIAS